MSAQANQGQIQSQAKPDYLYRSGVGIMLINAKKEIFVGKRIDNNSDAWQMPQGGLDVAEEEDVAMFRELKEETGIDQIDVKVLKKSLGHHYYNLPYKLQKKFWGGKYLGQKQRWYLAEFIGDDAAINIATEHPEFSDWKWIAGDEIISAIVGFKRELYEDVLREFKGFL
ncbi:MAG: RNA pyrophosphohydrolase [Rickettsiales bacterium]|nr:RNA pyrophosphohydrolase [Rickettsiales bacterium]